MAPAWRRCHRCPTAFNVSQCTDLATSTVNLLYSLDRMAQSVLHAACWASSPPFVPVKRRRQQHGMMRKPIASAVSGAKQAVPATPQPAPPPSGEPQGNLVAMGVAMGFQAAALIGAVVTGVLARRRRTEMQALNEKLRQINAELRRQRDAQESILSAVGLGAAEPPGLAAALGSAPGGGLGPAEAAAAAAAAAAAEGSDSDAGSDGEVVSEGEGGISGIQAAAALEALRRQAELLQQERAALEAALASPSAAHPTELYGDQRLSMARARRQIAQCIRGSKELVRDGRPGEVFPLLEQGLQLAAETSDLRAERALIRVRARALRESGDPAGTLRDLQRSLVLSQELEETAGDADTYGEMGDVLTELGDLESAGKYYDLCIAAIQSEAQQPLSSTWDV
ncbi:hypothetical protein ABPG75_001691 [Micractinium tetrahymenae]